MIYRANEIRRLWLTGTLSHWLLGTTGVWDSWNKASLGQPMV